MNKLCPNNKLILKKINSVVSGHIKAKIALITAFNRSYLRYYQHYINNIPYELCISNKNVLLCGQSGSGKTYLVEQLAKIMDVPFLCINATELTPSGNDDGYNIKELRKKIILHAESLKGTAAHLNSLEGILSQLVIFVDEIDKLGTGIGNNWCKHVQANFLKFFENKDTYKSITFIFAGAFIEITNSIKRNFIGFNSTIDKNNIDDPIENRIIDYGLIPELIGRIHAIVEFDRLTYNDYKDVLNNFIIPSKKKELKYIKDLMLYLTEEEEKNIIEKAMNSNQGIRSLIKSIDRIVEDIEFDKPYNISF